MIFIRKLKESYSKSNARATSSKPESRSENQPRAGFGRQHGNNVDRIFIFWKTCFFSSISAVPGLVEEGAKTEDLQHGSDKSSLFDSLHLVVNSSDSSECDKRSNYLNSAVRHNSLLPERRCLAAHPPHAPQDGINLMVKGKTTIHSAKKAKGTTAKSYLLVGSQLKQALSGLEA